MENKNRFEQHCKDTAKFYSITLEDATSKVVALGWKVPKEINKNGIDTSTLEVGDVVELHLPEGISRWIKGEPKKMYAKVVDLMTNDGRRVAIENIQNENEYHRTLMLNKDFIVKVFKSDD